jgi:hypothetical protein
VLTSENVLKDFSQSSLRRPINIILSPEEWHRWPHICGFSKTFKPFGLDPLYLGLQNNSPVPPYLPVTSSLSKPSLDL